jgi:NADH-quinone oxidoreductase subunit J
MTTRPRLYTSKSQIVGLVAFALFAVFTVVFLTADFGPAETFNGAERITATIGYAMISLDAGTLPVEGFLVSFLIIAVVLDAALDATVMLAKRDEDETDTTTVTDGGREGGDRR